jgi:hypothetical protein
VALLEHVTIFIYEEKLFIEMAKIFNICSLLTARMKNYYLLYYVNVIFSIHLLFREIKFRKSEWGGTNGRKEECVTDSGG